MRLLPLLLVVAPLVLRAASNYIGSGASLPFPDAASHANMVNNRPGDNEVVAFNPPRFSWSYSPTNGDGVKDLGAYEFIFQLSTTTNFAATNFSIRTDRNSYNFLEPLTGSADWYWRVCWLRSTSAANWLTNWAATPFYTNRVRHFTIAVTATNWDRSFFADTNYMAVKTAHPFMFFSPTNRLAVSNYLYTAQSNFLANNGTEAMRQIGRSWSNILKDATNTVALPG